MRESLEKFQENLLKKSLRDLGNLRFNIVSRFPRSHSLGKMESLMKNEQIIKNFDTFLLTF